MRVLVTGSSGYIGSAMVLELRSHDVETIGIDQAEPGPLIKPDTFVRLNLLDTPRLAQELAYLRPDAIVHMAGVALVGESTSKPGLYFSQNTGVMASLVAALESSKLRVPLVFSSTCAVYGQVDGPIHEEMECHPVNPYGKSKLLAEEILVTSSKHLGFPAIALRYFNVVGSWGPGHSENHEPETHVLPNLLRAALTGCNFEIYGGDYNTADGTAVRDYIHVRDLVAAHYKSILMLLDSPVQFNRVNLGGGRGISVMELVQAVKKRHSSLLFSVHPRRVGDPDLLVANILKARELINFDPAPLNLDSLLDELEKVA